MRFIKYTVENEGGGEAREYVFRDLSVVRGSRGNNNLAEVLSEWMWRLAGDCESRSAVYHEIPASLEIEEDERFIIRANGSGPVLVKENETASSPLPPRLARFVQNVPRRVFHDTSYISVQGESATFVKTVGDIVLRDRSNFYSMAGRIMRWAPGGDGIETMDSSIRDTERSIGECDRSRQIEEIRTSRAGKLKREMEKLREDVERMRLSIETYQRDQEMMGTVLKDLERRTQVEKRIEEIRQEIHSEQEKQRRITEMRGEITAQFPRFTGREGTPDLEILQSIFIEARDLNERIDQARAGRSRKAGILKKWIAGINLSIGTAIGTLLLRSGIGLQKDLLLFVSLLGGDLIMSFVLIVCLIKIPLNKREDEFLKERKDIEDRLAPLLAGTNMHLEGYRLSELYEFFLQYFEDYVAYSEKRRELGELEASACEGRYLSSIRSELGSLREENDTLRKRIGECMGQLPLQGEGDHAEEILDLVRLRQGEIDILREDIDRKMKILAGIEKDLSMTRDTSDEIRNLAQAMESLEQRLGTQKTAREAIIRVAGAMAGAVDRRRSRRLGELAGAAHDVFRRTGPGEQDRDVSEEIFFRFISGDSSVFTVVPFYELAFATKLALTDFLIDADMMLPLVINDPFHAMDDDRIPAFRDIFRSVAGKRQVILITSRRDLADWGHLIEL